MGAKKEKGKILGKQNERLKNNDKFSVTLSKEHTKLHVDMINKPTISKARQWTFPLLLTDSTPSTYWPPM